MGLFEKKFCDICGNKISLLGNKKLADGNMCKDCERKLSSWFDGRRNSTLEQIKAQLSYRELNQNAVAGFSATKKIGFDNDKFFLLDEGKRTFIILREGEAMDKNPDVLELTKVRDVHLEVKEDRSEVRHKDANGNSVSFNPKHYSYKYRFVMTIDYDGEYFNTLQFPINLSSINGGADGDGYNGMMTQQSGLILAGAADMFLGQLGIENNVQEKIVRSGSWSQRNDLPGGYRPDGCTTMTDRDIRLYRECEAIGREIISCLLKKPEPVQTAQPAQNLSPIERLEAQYPDIARARAIIAEMEGNTTPSGTGDMSEAVKNAALSGGVGVMGLGNTVQPMQPVQTESAWTCAYCGAVNSGKFCKDCGAPKQ